MTKILNFNEFKSISEKLKITPTSIERVNKALDNVKKQTDKLITRNKLVLNKESGLYDCDSDVRIYYFNLVNGRLPIRFGTVKGSFTFVDCGNLTSLQGSPIEVGDDFDCSYAVKLETLEGAPQKVDGDFKCYNCDNLKTLKGAPQKIKHEFNCNSCISLTTLEYAPIKVKQKFNCSYCDSLVSLEGAPQELETGFICNNCKSLTSLKGAPKNAGSFFICSDCESLTSMEYCPKAQNYIDFENCIGITSLDGLQQDFCGTLYLKGCDNIKDFAAKPKHAKLA